MFVFPCGEKGIRRGGHVSRLAHEVIYAVTDDEVGIEEKENWAQQKKKIGLALRPRRPSSVNLQNTAGLAISSTAIN